MLTIDGSVGEGGGQALRTSLALSLVTGTPLRIESIRARRPRPGLMRQHLTAVQAAAAVGRAEVRGAEIGSQALEFVPRGLAGGEHRFAIGTAGSATLVIQTVLPALLRAAGPSTLIVEGGTHNPLAPPFEFLERVYLPLLQRMGAQVQATLEKPGFYPAGGGRVRVAITPTARLQPLALLDRGAPQQRRASALLAALPVDIARRELSLVRAQLDLDESACHVVALKDSSGPGNVVEVELELAENRELFTAFGERGVRAEAVAQKVVDEVRAFVAAQVPVGAHLADQLLLPLALAGEGAFVTQTPTPHFETQCHVLARFGVADVTRHPLSPHAIRCEVRGRAGS
jgi:RNA 3'-terminal phosphate cyclase (ATP)